MGSRRDDNVWAAVVSFVAVTQAPGRAALDRGLEGPGETEASARRPRHPTKLTSTRMFAVVRRLRAVALSGGLAGHGRIRPCPAPTHHRSSVGSGAGLRASLGDWRGPRRPLPVQASLRILAGSATSCLHPGLGKRWRLGTARATPRGMGSCHLLVAYGTTKPAIEQLRSRARPDIGPASRSFA
jgi:hypothetical protein